MIISMLWGACGLTAGFIFFIGYGVWWTQHGSAPKRQPLETRRRHQVSIHETQILKCQISHRRLFPKTHRFIYPYLSVGIPVRSPKSNWLLSVDIEVWWKRGWLQVSANDHLNRGRDGKTLSENIDSYLKAQGLDPASFPHIYLITSARFLNYVFKPASFWYLYTADTQLLHIVAEVNNTFDERRMYLFSAPDDTGKFRQTSTKDFHVSPFNSRKGSYVVTSSSPHYEENISLCTTLRSSKGYPKLVARWWSVEPAMNPSDLSITKSLWLLLGWGWTVPITYLRIVFQAVCLAQVRKLEIWYRPEPRESAVPRQPTTTEAFVATILMRYLMFLLQFAPACELSAPTSQLSSRLLPPRKSAPLEVRILRGGGAVDFVFRIHTPQFYRQLITYGKLSDYLSYAVLNPSEENRTAWSDDAQNLVALIRDLETAANEASAASPPRHSFVPRMVWAMYGYVRRVQHLEGSYPSPGLPAMRRRTCTASREAPISSFPRDRPHACFLDDFVIRRCGFLVQIGYMVATLGLQGRAWIMGVVGGE
ncbi:DUF1365-domain-containing protein [Hypoxylon sp. NC1633]|nr:DUF1365-domain-containing protein [Hypoxylon sp. NC1633]